MPPVRFWMSTERPALLLIVAPMVTLPVPWLISTSAPVVLVKVALITVTAPLTFVRLSALVPPDDVHLIDRDRARQARRRHRRESALGEKFTALTSVVVRQRDGAAERRAACPPGSSGCSA